MDSSTGPVLQEHDHPANGLAGARSWRAAAAQRRTLRRGAASPPPRASGAWRASSAPFPRRAGVRRRGAPPSAHRQQWHILFTCCQHVFFAVHMHISMGRRCTCCAHTAYYPSMVHMRCTFLLAGDGEVRHGGVRAVRCGRVRIVRQGVEMQVGQPVRVHRMHVQCTRAAYPTQWPGWM